MEHTPKVRRSMSSSFGGVSVIATVFSVALAKRASVENSVSWEGIFKKQVVDDGLRQVQEMAMTYSSTEVFDPQPTTALGEDRKPLRTEALNSIG